MISVAATESKSLSAAVAVGSISYRSLTIIRVQSASTEAWRKLLTTRPESARFSEGNKEFCTSISVISGWDNACFGRLLA